MSYNDKFPEGFPPPQKTGPLQIFQGMSRGVQGLTVVVGGMVILDIIQSLTTMLTHIFNTLQPIIQWWVR